MGFFQAKVLEWGAIAFSKGRGAGEGKWISAETGRQGSEGGSMPSGQELKACPAVAGEAAQVMQNEAGAVAMVRTKHKVTYSQVV